MDTVDSAKTRLTVMPAVSISHPCILAPKQPASGQVVCTRAGRHFEPCSPELSEKEKKKDAT